MRTITNAVVGMALFIVLIAIVGNCLSSNSNTPNNNSTTTSVPQPAATTSSNVPTATPKPDEPISNWEYSQTEDKMTSAQIKYASVVANQELQFEFPFNGGSIATFTIRKKDGSTNIYLDVSKGQFNDTFDGGNVKIRFDKNPPKTYSYTGASDGRMNLIFITSVHDVIANLKKAKTMLIEAEFFNEGNRQMEFDVSGLQW